MNTEVPYYTASSKEKYLLPYRMASKNSRWYFAIFHIFPIKWGLIFHSNCLLRRPPHFPDKIWKISMCPLLNLTKIKTLKDKLYECAWLLSEANNKYWPTQCSRFSQQRWIVVSVCDDPMRFQHSYLPQSVLLLDQPIPSWNHRNHCMSQPRI